ncbi:host-nuclease inhibitor Gam family protein [Aquimarina muelleri]|uniref:host-nuclease inhibitor Gam family protein n=1 Tax=Aquimarina muelleri TaxID=279356 RepID=UPI003F688AB7
MRTSRTKKKTVVPPLNTSEADRVLARYALAHAKREHINAEMDEKFTKIREEYAADLQDATDIVNENFQKLQMYYEVKPELFKKRKSLETAHGLIGFRTGTPKLKTLKGFTWAAVLKLLQSKKAVEFLRTKEEPAKDLLLAKREESTTKTLMAEVGIEVVQDDTFFIDLKKEEVEV